jgi:hypothetical protein
MEANDTILSRHRLPQPYRGGLVLGWLLLPGLVLAAIVFGRGMTPALFDPRFLLLLGVMAFPAVYIWQEGIDVHRDGIVARAGMPRRHAYSVLRGWYIHTYPSARILTIWDRDGRHVLQWHTAHLTDLPLLLDALRKHIPPD